MDARETYQAAIDAIDTLVDLDDEGALTLIARYAKQCASLFEDGPQPDPDAPAYPETLPGHSRG